MKYEIFELLKNYIIEHPNRKDSVTILELTKYQKEKNPQLFPNPHTYKTDLPQ